MTGTRISIIGNSGSGKSTLAKALGKELGIPVFHLDRHLMEGNYQKLPDDRYYAVYDELISGESWILDGNYNRVLGDRIARSTLVVFLDTSRAVTLFRVLKRLRGGGHAADTIPDTAKPASISWAFLKWTLGYSRRERAAYLRDACHVAGVPFLRSANQPIDKAVQCIVDHAARYD